jgi:glycosyltransferase involved in cell wall biosynthesis
MRIFMLVPNPAARGPVGKHTSHLVAALRSLGCTVVTHTWGSRREDESLPARITQRLRDVLSVRRGLQNEAFDVAVVKTAHDWRTLLRDIAVVLVIRRRKRPIILQLHGSRASVLVEPGHRAFKLVSALLLGLVDGIMVLSTEEQRQWQTFRRRPPIFTVKNPYVRSLPTDASEPMPISADMRVLFVGRLIEEKGVFDLVEAFSQILEQTQCDLVLVGAGEHEDRLRNRIRNLGLEDHVTMRGYLSGPALMDSYQASTIFVLPSYWAEGFPTVLAEAMDAALPIITTPIRGAADHLLTGENALFVEPRDRNGLASAIVALLRDPDLRARMGKANRARLRIFEPERVAAEYLDVLKSVVGVEAEVTPGLVARSRA